MKNLLIAANWKSYKTKIEAKEWLDNVYNQEIPESLKVLLLAPYTLLDEISGYIKVNDLFFDLGAQDISQFDEGAYTGEISGKQIKEFATSVLVGHSERRVNFSESDEIVNKKIEQAFSSDLKPIVCVSSLDQVKKLIPGNYVIAYEPIGAIGTGNAEDPKPVSLFVDEIKKIQNVDVLYGGSVNAQNISDYISLENISGALIGSASLEPSSFINILKNAS